MDRKDTNEKIKSARELHPAFKTIVLAALLGAAISFFFQNWQYFYYTLQDQQTALRKQQTIDALRFAFQRDEASRSSAVLERCRTHIEQRKETAVASYSSVNASNVLLKQAMHARALRSLAEISRDEGEVSGLSFDGAGRSPSIRDIYLSVLNAEAGFWDVVRKRSGAKAGDVSQGDELTLAFYKYDGSLHSIEVGKTQQDALLTYQQRENGQIAAADRYEGQNLQQHLILSFVLGIMLSLIAIIAIIKGMTREKLSEASEIEG